MESFLRAKTIHKLFIRIYLITSNIQNTHMYTCTESKSKKVHEIRFTMCRNWCSFLHWTELDHNMFSGYFVFFYLSVSTNNKNELWRWWKSTIRSTLWVVRIHISILKNILSRFTVIIIPYEQIENKIFHCILEFTCLSLL